MRGGHRSEGRPRASPFGHGLGGASPIVVAMGMASSVGVSAGAACAALAAGISRPAELPHFQVLDEDTQELGPATGHPVRGVTDGFLMLGCWRRLTEACLRDLRSQPGLAGTDTPAFWRRTGLLLAVPHPNNPRFQDEDGGGIAELEEAVLAPLLESSGLPLDPVLAEVAPLTHVGAAVAIRRAAELLQQGTADRVLVLGVDSYLDPFTLQWLANEARLKTPENPTGLLPGEAAACVLLEGEASVRSRKAPRLATITDVAVAQGTSGQSEHSDSSQALGECLRAVLGPLRGPPFAGDAYSDCNGETWRAQETSLAMQRLRSRWGGARLHFPAISIGDVGAASGVVGVCLATHEILRRRARPGPTLVMSMSDFGEGACISVHAAASGGRASG